MKTDVIDEQVLMVQTQLEERVIPYRQTNFDGQTIFVTIDSPESKIPEASLFWASLLELAGVEEILVIPAPMQGYALTSYKAKKDRTAVEIGPMTIGNGHFAIIGGPCSVESEEQITSTAHAVKKSGASGLRGGAFKPRTAPYDFQGMGEDGLKLLAKAREETGLPIVTEAMTPEEVPLVAQYADMIQVGARNMQNYRLLTAVGKLNMPVLLKRGFNATLDEFLMAAEYILHEGNHRVVLCERGIRTFETDTRFTLALASVPLLKRRTHLPIIVDPSHAVGIYKLVPSMSAAAVAAGADGLLIEVHPDPAKAKCDGRQSLTFEEFKETVDICKKIRSIISGTELINRNDSGFEQDRVIPIPHRLESYIQTK